MYYYICLLPCSGVLERRVAYGEIFFDATTVKISFSVVPLLRVLPGGKPQKGTQSSRCQ